MHRGALRLTEILVQTISLIPPWAVLCHVFTAEKKKSIPIHFGKRTLFLQCYKSLQFPLVSRHTCQDELQLHSVWNSHPVNVLGVKVFYYIFNWWDKQVWRQKAGEMLWHSQVQLPPHAMYQITLLTAHLAAFFFPQDSLISM